MVRLSRSAVQKKYNSLFSNRLQYSTAIPMFPFDQRGPGAALHFIRKQYIVQQKNTIQYGYPNVSIWPKKSKQCRTMHLKTLQCSAPEPIALRPSQCYRFTKEVFTHCARIVLHCSVCSELVSFLHGTSLCTGLCTVHFNAVPWGAPCCTLLYHSKSVTCFNYIY